MPYVCPDAGARFYNASNTRLGEPSLLAEHSVLSEIAAAARREISRGGRPELKPLNHAARGFNKHAGGTRSTTRLNATTEHLLNARLTAPFKLLRNRLEAFLAPAHNIKPFLIYLKAASASLLLPLMVDLLTNPVCVSADPTTSALCQELGLGEALVPVAEHGDPVTRGVTTEAKGHRTAPSRHSISPMIAQLNGMCRGRPPFRLRSKAAE